MVRQQTEDVNDKFEPFETNPSMLQIRGPQITRRQESSPEKGIGTAL
jgi:hypothetical protein